MKSIVMSTLFVIGFFSLNIFAQEPQPQANLRLAEECRKINGPENLKPGQVIKRCFVVEIYMPESLDPEKYGEPFGNRVCPDNNGREINCPLPDFARLFNGRTISPDALELSENDGLLAAGRRNRIFAIYLPSDFNVIKPLQVLFDPYPSRRGTLRFPTLSVESDFKVTFVYDNYKKITRQKIELNNDPIKCSDIDETKKAAAAARAKADADRQKPQLEAAAKEAEEAVVYAVNCRQDATALRAKYIDEGTDRLVALRDWLKIQDLKNVEIRVEDLTKCLKFNDKGCSEYEDWTAFRKTLNIPDLEGMPDEQKALEIYKFLKSKKINAPMPSQPPTDEEFALLEERLFEYEMTERDKFQEKTTLTADDLPINGVRKVSTAPQKDGDIKKDKRLIVDYYTENGFPAKFSTQLTYKNATPKEISRPLKVVAQEITQVAVNTKEDTGSVGERVRPNRLDVGFQFGTSVGEKEETIDGVTVKNIKRTSRGTVDLRVSAFRPLEKGEWFSWEPVFLDAKVSNDKITGDTLSLNRVVIGTRFDFTNFLNFKNSAASNPTYLNFVVKPVQASDRDFKQLEYKLIGEFEPRLAFLNRIPANFKNTVNKVITNPGETQPTRFVEPSWGYKISPLIGGEIGKTWLRRRPAEAIEPTDYIKRFYAGLDMTFYAPFNVSFSLYDKFYWNFGKDRNGKNVDGRENYFKASLDIGIRKTRGFGDSIYLSFEKGNEPPFGARDINAFKVGYRFVNPKLLRFW